MKAFPLYLLATAALCLSLTSCDTTSSKKEAAQTSETAATADTAAASTPNADGSAPAATTTTTPTATNPAAAQASAVALPAGLKAGRWQGYLVAKNHAVHFGFEVAVEANKAIAYLINQGSEGQERLRCDTVRPIGDSAIISLPGTQATLVVRANGTDHLTGAWVQPEGKKAARTVFNAVYGEQSPLRQDAATPNLAGTWRATFRSDQGKTYPATVVIAQQGAKLAGSLTGSGGTYRYLSGAALAGGMGISSFDGRNGVLLQAKKLPNGTLKGNFYAGQPNHETWTAVPVPQGGASQ
ncbi:hypothetical protein MON38_17470 [Hymenobacter sp. DH14]|uniref:Lipoprotein n=1 Tax=Hymenobacter cyanobacteriorum TaxID=2926463 RepID=A0A9X2AGU8_9BACT|nr:hypothetical protein [Hymenobacter cyanobacteriorum]MCI1189217.1 hypothetical protein [Hymenobacter cyanobacteriorum]